MDGKCEWFINDLKSNFGLYNMMNVYKLKLDLEDKLYLYFLVFLRFFFFIFNYNKEKFILLPSFLVRSSQFPSNTNYVYCGGGKIILNNSHMEKRLVMRIDTSFLPVGMCYIALNDTSIYEGLKVFMNNSYIKYLIKRHDLESRDSLFKDLSRQLSLLSLTLFYEKVK